MEQISTAPLRSHSVLFSRISLRSVFFLFEGILTKEMDGVDFLRALRIVLRHVINARRHVDEEKFPPAKRFEANPMMYHDETKTSAYSKYNNLELSTLSVIEAGSRLDGLIFQDDAKEQISDALAFSELSSQAIEMHSVCFFPIGDTLRDAQLRAVDLHAELVRDTAIVRNQNEQFFSNSLFSEQSMKIMNFQLETVLGSMELNQGAMKFWRNWYKSFLDGNPLDWELQRRVAMIPDPIWEAGPERVAEEIEKIRALFELEKRIEELEAERTAVEILQNRTGIGGNSPPEPIEDEAKIVEQVTIIWAAIGELKEEAKKEQPDKAVFARIITILAAGLAKIRAFVAKAGAHTALLVYGAAVSSGTTALIQKPELLEAVIEAAKTALPFLH